MDSLVHQCVSGVRHPLVAGGIGMALGLGLGLLAPGLGLVVSLGPLVAILLCLLPCLAPLLLLRRVGRAPAGANPTTLPDRSLLAGATRPRLTDSILARCRPRSAGQHRTGSDADHILHKAQAREGACCYWCGHWA